MTITQNFNRCNSASAQGTSYPIFVTENETPNCWHLKIKHASKPDLVAITILIELLALHHDNDNEQDQKQQGLELTNCFAYFQNKFQLKRMQIRKAASRLHNMGLVVCAFRKIIINSRIYAGVSTYQRELELKLNIDQLNIFCRRGGWLI